MLLCKELGTDSKSEISIQSTDLYQPVLSLRAAMRNEDIAEAMRAMEINFKQHAEGQLAKFTSLLEQYMESTEARLAKLTHKGEKVEGSKNGGPTDNHVHDPTNLYSILKTLRVNVPRFDGSEVEEWIYKIDKFFTLHRLPLDTRLSVVAFHLDGEAST